MAYQHYRSPFGDTTYTKVFVGGLAWETHTDVMRRYFEQFGEILEAVIITDKHTAKSKGYGFVTYRDPESAKRACDNPNPVIDGRRANCNIASLGRPRPSPPRGRGQGGNPYQGGGILQGPSSSTYSGVTPPLPLPLPPQPTTPVIYPPYGYATYTPDYYHQGGMYNPQYQQAQYYQQISSTPYYYGYSMQGSRATPFSANQQRFQAPYLYYPTPSHLPNPSAPSFSPFNPPPLQSPVTRPQLPSSTTESHVIPQQTPGETTEVGTVATESPSS